MRKVSEEIMRFMRGKYALDEIGNSVDELTFCENEDVIIKIQIYNDHYDFYIDNDCISLTDLESLENIKSRIIDKKKPNRNSFPKENAIYADCGHRCDLCVHYTGAAFTDEFRIEIGNRIERAYNIKAKDLKPINSIQELYKRRTPCGGCQKGGISKIFDCYQRKCATENGVDKCMNCTKYPCDKACVGLPPEIHTGIILEGDVTWGILPFVYKQYGN
jgi:hypothetical protein